MVDILHVQSLRIYVWNILLFVRIKKTLRFKRQYEIHNLHLTLPWEYPEEVI